MPMRCEQLQHLLEADALTPFDENTERLATHLRTCPRCQAGIVRLSKALTANDTLSCEQCRRRLPTLYEATRPEHPLVKMPEEEIKRILIHLSHCTGCQKDYRFLAELDEMESSREGDHEKREET